MPHSPRLWPGQARQRRSTPDCASCAWPGKVYTVLRFPNATLQAFSGLGRSGVALRTSRTSCDLPCWHVDGPRSLRQKLHNLKHPHSAQVIDCIDPASPRQVPAGEVLPWRFACLRGAVSAAREACLTAPQTPLAAAPPWTAAQGTHTSRWRIQWVIGVPRRLPCPPSLPQEAKPAASKARRQPLTKAQPAARK